MVSYSRFQAKTDTSTTPASAGGCPQESRYLVPTGTCHVVADGCNLTKLWYRNIWKGRLKSVIRSGNKNSLVVIISAELRRGHGATCHPHTGRSALTRRLRLFYMAAIARRTFDIVTIWTILFHRQTCKHGIKLRAFKKNNNIELNSSPQPQHAVTKAWPRTSALLGWDCLHYPDVLCRIWPRPPTQKSLLWKSWIGQNINMAIWRTTSPPWASQAAVQWSLLQATDHLLAISSVIFFSTAVVILAHVLLSNCHSIILPAKLCRVTCDSVTCDDMSRCVTSAETWL